MPTESKTSEIELLAERLGRAQMTILTEYRGLTMVQMEGFRAKLREVDGEFRVTKNTLLRIAAERAGIEGFGPFLEGPTAVLFAYSDVAGVAKAASDFVKSSRIMTIKAGTMEGQLLDLDAVEAISNLPSREELQGKLVGMLASPMARVVGVLGGPARSVAYLLNARQEALGGSASEAAD